MNKITSAINLVTDILKESNIDHVFGLPGGYTQFLMGAVNEKEGIKTITARHEGSAAAMADLYGRMTGKPGVLMGQGVWIGSNGGFGIIESFLAGSPMVIITDVSDWSGMNLRANYQCGTGDYGCVDLPNVFKSMTKYMTYATSPKDFVFGVQMAIKHAVSGRPGPACVLTNENSILGDIEDPSALDPPIYSTEKHLNVNPPSITQSKAREIAESLINSENPVMICGQGVHASKAYDEVQELAELLGIPVATSYMGKSSISENHDLALGVTSSRGQKLANEMVQDADTILTVGSALSPENTNNCSKDFIDTEEQDLIQIDIDPRNIGWTYPADIGVTADAKKALNKIITATKKINPDIDAKKRIEKIKSAKQKPENKFYTSEYYSSDEVPIEPERVVKEINEIIREDDLLVLDAGNSRIWFTSLFKSNKAGQVIAPGGAAGMAWGPNAAISAQMLNDDGKVVSIVGDGSMLMVLYVLETVKAYDLPVTYVVLNNSSLGNVRDFFGEENKPVAEYPETNFADIAETMGIQGIRVEEVEDLNSSLEKGLKSDVPTLVEVIVNRASHIRIRE